MVEVVRRAEPSLKPLLQVQLTRLISQPLEARSDLRDGLDSILGQVGDTGCDNRGAAP